MYLGFTYQPSVGKFSVHVISNVLESCQTGIHRRETRRDLAARKHMVYHAACWHGLLLSPEVSQHLLCDWISAWLWH